MVLATPALAQSSTTDAIVEAMRTMSGKQSRRLSGAKGQCFTARLTPTAEARQLSKSSAFSSERAAVVRFSVRGGNARVADATKTVNRGLALRIDPDGPGQSEFVMVNAPVNLVKSPEQMLGFLQARLTGVDGEPDAAKVEAFTDANPETTNQGRFLASRPVPASWVGVSYSAIHPYTLTNAQGATQIVKFAYRFHQEFECGQNLFDSTRHPERSAVHRKTRRKGGRSRRSRCIDRLLWFEADDR